MNFINQARTYATLGDHDKSIATVEKARDILRGVANWDDSNPLAWQGRAWLDGSFQALQTI
jgi:hypothetical protein